MSTFYEKLNLHDKNQIPVLGMGVGGPTPKERTKELVLAALAAGIKHIDTAVFYGNEEQVGEAIRESKQKDIFVTTKLYNTEHDDIRKACRFSRRRLGTTTIDLYLMHWPVKQRVESWKKMIQLSDYGFCKSIGVSNFTINHLEELKKHTSVMPAVNQVEFNPFLYQKELLEYCNSEGIVLEAYGPFGGGKRLSDEHILSAAKELSKTPAQIMLRWIIQHDMAVIFSSSKVDRIKENTELDFEIPSDLMDKLDSLNKNERTYWDPSKEI